MKKIAFLPLLVLISCSTGPEAPLLLFPVDDAKIYNQPFQWMSVSEATSYLLEIGSEPTFSNPLISSEVSDTIYFLTAAQQSLFQNDVTYYWHVYSAAGETLGKESQIRKFTIAGSIKP